MDDLGRTKEAGKQIEPNLRQDERLQFVEFLLRFAFGLRHDGKDARQNFQLVRVPAIFVEPALDVGIE